MKPLIEDITRENADVFASSWRSAKSTDAEMEALSEAAHKLMQASDVKAFIALSVKEVITQISDNSDSGNKFGSVMLNTVMSTTSGIMLGLKYAQYLYEQRELAVMEKEIANMEVVAGPEQEGNGINGLPERIDHEV